LIYLKKGKKYIYRSLTCCLAVATDLYIFIPNMDKNATNKK